MFVVCGKLKSSRKVARRRVDRVRAKSVNSSNGPGNDLEVIALRLDFDVLSASFAENDLISPQYVSKKHGWCLQIGVLQFSRY